MQKILSIILWVLAQTFEPLEDLRKIMRQAKKQLKKAILSSFNQKRKQENKYHQDRKKRDKRISDIGGLCDKLGYRHIIEQGENRMLGILLTSVLNNKNKINQERHEATLEILGKNTFENFHKDKGESIPRDHITYQMGAICEKLGLDLLASNGKKRFVLGLLKKAHDDYLLSCNDEIKKQLSQLGKEAFKHTEESETRFIDITVFANKSLPL